MGFKRHITNDWTCNVAFAPCQSDITDEGIPRCCWTGCACADRTGTAGWRFLWRKAVKVTLAENELISTLNAKVDEMSDVLYVAVSCGDVRTVSSAPVRSCELRGAMSVVACG